MEDVILFNVNHTVFAIAANAVDEIRNLDGLTIYSAGSFAQSKLQKVKYTLVREKKDRDRCYFVVDASAHFHMPQSRGGRVLVFRNSLCALLVDSIDRMTQIATVFAMPKAFQGEECNWYRGLAVMEGCVVPVVNPDAVLSKGEVAVLQAGMKTGAVAHKPARSAALA